MRPAMSNRGTGVPSSAYVFNPQLPGEVLGQIEGTSSTSRGKWVGGHPETRRSADDMMIDEMMVEKLKIRF